MDNKSICKVEQRTQVKIAQFETFRINLRFPPFPIDLVDAIQIQTDNGINSEYLLPKWTLYVEVNVVVFNSIININININK